MITLKNWFDEDGNYKTPIYEIFNGVQYDKVIELWERLERLEDKVRLLNLPQLYDEIQIIFDNIFHAVSTYNYQSATTNNFGKDSKNLAKLHKELINKGVYTN